MLPNHVLILGAPRSGKLRVANILSKNLPSSQLGEVPSDSHSGIIMKASVTTKYYSVDLNLLIDEFPEHRSANISGEKALQSLNKWTDEFVSEEYQELREVLDGFIFCIDIENDSIDHIESCLEFVGRIRQKLSNNDENDWSGFLAIVGTTTSSVPTHESILEQVEDAVISNGLEFIDLQQNGENEFREKIGTDRLVELIETHEWTHMDLVSVNYQTNKTNRAKEMTKGLLDVEEEVDNDEEEHNEEHDTKTMDLSEIMLKLQVARDNARTLTSDQREIYINNIIEEMIDYI